MLTLQQIIDEAYTLVPNEVDTADQVVWLNSINQEFFNVVKIPKIFRFTTTTSGEYTTSTDVREKNIDYVQIGLLRYISLDEDNVAPLQNVYSYEDATNKLTLSPVPYNSGLQGILRYRRIATTTFVSNNLGVSPDAPDEYHWTFIPALASYLANTQHDAANAANYEAQYRSAWNSAAQDYLQRVIA